MTDDFGNAFDEAFAPKVVKLRVIISGADDFDDAPLFARTMKDVVSGFEREEVFVFTGTAKSGAEALAAAWCQKARVAIERIPPCVDVDEEIAASVRDRELAHHVARLMHAGDVGVCVFFPTPRCEKPWGIVSAAQACRVPVIIGQGQALER